MRTGIALRLCLPYAEASPEHVTALCSELMLFEPVSFFPTWASDDGDPDLDFSGFLSGLRKQLAEHADRIEMEAWGDTNIIGIGDGLCVHYWEITDLLCIELTIASEVYDTVQETVHRFAASNPVASAALYRREESDWNSYADVYRWENPDVNISIAKARAEHPELAEIITFPGSSNPKFRRIDARQFPGYVREVRGIWFGCRHEMWFGRAYDQYIPLDLLSQFTACAKNETLGNGTVHIVMYDAPDRFRGAESVKRAFAFRALTDYVSRAERRAESKGKKPEP